MTAIVLADEIRLTSYHPSSASTGPFAVGFPIFELDDLAVYVDDVLFAYTAGTPGAGEFSVAGTFADGGYSDAEVTLGESADDVDVDIYGHRAPQTPSAFANGAPIPPQDLQTAINKITATQREMWDQMPAGNATAAAISAAAAAASAGDAEDAQTAAEAAQAAAEASAAALAITVISPAQITSTQNDYAPTGYATAQMFLLDLDAARSITGLNAASGNGARVTLVNTSAYTLTLSNASSSSSAANRFAFAADVLVFAGKAVSLIYDSTTARWRLPTLPAKLIGIEDSAGYIAATDVEAALAELRQGAIGTRSTSTGATSVAFTSVIPAWAREIILNFAGVSLSGTDNILFQLGVAGTYVTTGYSSASAMHSGAGNALTAVTTTGMVMLGGNAAYTYTGSIIFRLMGSNQWVSTTVCDETATPLVGHGSGSITLAGTPDSIRLITAGSNTVDANAGVNWLAR